MTTDSVVQFIANARADLAHVPLRPRGAPFVDPLPYGTLKRQAARMRQRADRVIDELSNQHHPDLSWCIPVLAGERDLPLSDRDFEPELEA